jgi:hypothetical protein
MIALRSEWGERKMTIGIIVIPALVLLATTMIARLLELQNDVLYGPYVAGRKNPVVRFRDEAGEILESLGLRRGLPRLALKIGTLGVFASAIIG